MPRLPKHHAGQERRTFAITISLPIELVPLLDHLAQESGRNRSNYLSWLLRKAGERAKETP